MRILIDIGHPGHVHFYKNFIWKMQENGHNILVTNREKDVTTKLLNHYNINHITISRQSKNIYGLSYELLHRWRRLISIIKRFQPDFITEIGGAFIALPSKICGVPSIIFNDSEPVPTDTFITYPFAEKILTPKCFLKDLGQNHIRYNGYHEIAYLHPDYFKPDFKIKETLGIEKSQPYFILRLVSWKASHDINQSGFSFDWIKKIIAQLEKYGKVLISSESELPKKLKIYQIRIPPWKMHDALYYADLFMGDGATMATESGLLGTPAIRTSSLVGTMGNFTELMQKFKLVYSYKSQKQAIEKVLDILNNNKSKKIWKERKNRLFDEKINVTKFMINFFENYPNNLNIVETE